MRHAGRLVPRLGAMQPMHWLVLLVSSLAWRDCLVCRRGVLVGSQRMLEDCPTVTVAPNVGQMPVPMVIVTFGLVRITT